MFGSKPTAEQQQAQANKEQITKSLRSADEFVRYNRFEEALVQIDLVLALDAKNVLARSFKERIRMMQKRAQADSAPEKPHAMTEEEKNATIARLLSSAEEYIHKQDYKLALNKVSEVYKIDSQNAYARAFSDRIEQLQSQQKTEAEKLFGAPENVPQTGTAQVHGAFFMYRELMKEVWADGKVTNEEAQELKIVRDLFGITEKEHYTIQREVKLEAYLNALRLAWRDGVLTMNEKAVLEMMRQRYGITTEEHVACEVQIQEAKKGTPTKAAILVVDSDNAHRLSVVGFLKKMNYEVIAAASVEDAFHAIVNQFPHIVLAEIVYNANQQDGFSLFEKMQEHPSLQHVPFFFMSRMKDSKIIRAALRLGLDLYFPKPVDQELLLAAIEGRLKRQ